MYARQWLLGDVGCMVYDTLCMLRGAFIKLLRSACVLCVLGIASVCDVVGVALH